MFHSLLFKFTGNLVYYFGYHMIDNLFEVIVQSFGLLIIIILLVLRFGDMNLLIIVITFRISELTFSFIVIEIFTTIKIVFANVIILSHFFNPVSALRIIEFCYGHSRNVHFDAIVISFIRIIDDFLIIIKIPVNLICSPIKFFKELYKFISDFFSILFNGTYNEKLESFKEDKYIPFNKCPYYLMIKYQFIDPLFFKNLKFIVGIIFFILNFVVFWRLKNSITYFKDYLINNDLTLFSLKTASNIVKGILEILYFPIFILVHINYFTRRCKNEI